MPEAALADPRVRDLVGPSIAALERMVQPSGLFGYELVEGEAGMRGESVRYTLIVLLGLLRARAAGVDVPQDLDALVAAADRSAELTPGDVGLRLWVEARRRGDDVAALTERLSASLDQRPLHELEGMEVAWIAIGLAETGASTARGQELLASALDQLLAVNQAKTGLLRHFGASGARRRFPNFATQIYGVLALAVAARAGVDERALDGSRRCADALLAVQLPDGGWPWLYDAERGAVVEPYEVYSVHQHGMAPMALRELASVAGEPRYAEAATRGEAWMFGANELGQDMAPLHSGMTYRSIRRRAPLDRLALYANTAAARLGRRPLVRAAAAVEINRTCRPYELGWLVEAAVGETGRSA